MSANAMVSYINFQHGIISELLKEIIVWLEANDVYLWDIFINTVKSEDNEYSAIVYYVRK